VTIARPRTLVSAPLTFSPALEYVNYWMAHYASPIDDFQGIGLNYSSFITEHWKRASPDSSFNSALLAVAHAAYGRARGIHKLIDDGALLYGQTLAKVKSEIETLAPGDFDQLLITVMLMSTFEVSQVKHCLITRLAQLCAECLWRN
jgi:hypothetical protein